VNQTAEGGFGGEAAQGGSGNAGAPAQGGSGNAGAAAQGASGEAGSGFSGRSTGGSSATGAAGLHAAGTSGTVGDGGADSNGGGAGEPTKDIRWEPSALEFVAVRGLPSPWRLSELWLNFDEFSAWRTKPGFRVLATIEGDGATQPVSFVREWGNFRSFYTVIGHVSTSFEDANVRRHIAAGMLWTVRREHWLD